MASVTHRSLAASAHDRLIEDLAQETRAPLEHVRELFEDQHAQLHAEARVKTYVSVITLRLVRNTLHAERKAAH